MNQIYTVPGIVLAVVIAGVTYGFPVYYGLQTEGFPNLYCPCCLSSSESAIGTGPKIPTGCQAIDGFLQTLMFHLSTVKKQANDLHSTLVKRLTEHDRNEVMGKHWPYVYKLEATQTSVDEAIAMGPEGAWSVLYSQLMLYLKYLNFIHEDELNWSGRHDGLRQREVTFEEMTSYFETPHLVSFHCAFYQLLESGNVKTPQTDIDYANGIHYRQESEKRLADMRNVIILNSFKEDFIVFLNMYLTKYRNTTICN